MCKEEIKANHLKDFSDKELMLELKKRKEKINIPRLVSEINSKIKELNNLGVKIIDDDDTNFNLSRIVEYEENPGNYYFETSLNKMIK